jgi:TonB family protein
MSKIPLFLALFCLAALPLRAAKTTPQLIEGQQPVYPEQLKQKGEQGEAKILTHIDANGTVTDASVRSATHEAFGLAALEAVKTWRFKPATGEDGQPVAAKVVIPFPFRYTPPSPPQPALSGKEQFNAEMGRAVFVDITTLTDKVCTWAELEKWIPLRGNHTNRVPYPAELKGSGLSEEIQVQVIISPEGYVHNPTFVGIKNQQFLLPALRHIANVRFETPKVDGKPVYAQQKIKLICSEDPNFGKKPARTEGK